MLKSGKMICLLEIFTFSKTYKNFLELQMQKNQLHQFSLLGLAAKSEERYFQAKFFHMFVCVYHINYHPILILFCFNQVSWHSTLYPNYHLLIAVHPNASTEYIGAWDRVRSDSRVQGLGEPIETELSSGYTGGIQKGL